MIIIKDTGAGCVATSYCIEDDYKTYQAMEAGEEKDALTQPPKNKAYEERKANLQADEIVAPEVLPTEDPLFWYIENGELKVRTDEVNAQIKLSKWEELKVLRDIKLREDFTYREAQFQSDDTSVRNMQIRLSGMSNGDIITWLDSDNVPHSFSDGDLESMLKIIGDRGDVLYGTSWAVRAVINDSDDPLSIVVSELYDGALL